jgi:hypothetical protein
MAGMYDMRLVFNMMMQLECIRLLAMQICSTAVKCGIVTTLAANNA